MIDFISFCSGQSISKAGMTLSRDMPSNEHKRTNEDAHGQISGSQFYSSGAEYKSQLHTAESLIIS